MRNADLGQLTKISIFSQQIKYGYLNFRPLVDLNTNNLVLSYHSNWIISSTIETAALASADM